MERRRPFDRLGRWAPRSLALVFTLALLAPVSLAAPASVQASHAPSVALSGSVTGSSATMTAHRDGWGAIVSVAVRDTRSDGDCAFATVYLRVANGSDPNRRTENCSGVGTTLRRHFRLAAPRIGTAISQIALKVCRNVAFNFDPCVTKTVTLPQMTRHGTASRIAATDAIMRLSLASFKVRKAQAAPPYDWNDDGCSVPGWLPFTSKFKLACQRHDFGYRNFGGDNAFQPTDARRALVDSRFKQDMRAICLANYTLLRPLCYASANAGYGIVRTLGGRAFFD